MATNRFKITNRILAHENVSGVEILLMPVGAAPNTASKISGKTDAQGALTSNTALTDGNYTLAIAPPTSWADEVGPGLAEGTTATRIFRSMNMTVFVRGGVVGGIVSGGDNGGKASATGGLLKVELQPVFIKSPNHNPRGTSIDLILVHHTAGPSLASAVNQFLTNGTTSSHYLVDKDGQIVKMVADSMAAWHAGVTHWDGKIGLNANSIGIEIVNKDGESFSDLQYTAVIGLIKRLMAAYPHILPDRVVGHSDVGTNESGRLGRKSSCPGSLFEWTRLEKSGYGMIPSGAGEAIGTIYGGYFAANGTSVLKNGDHDDKHVFGGKANPAFEGTPVRDVQQDLMDIGYSVGTPSGNYDEKTHFAVQMFQEHFFAGGRGGKPTGSVDAATAQMIKRVLNGPSSTN